MKSASQQTVLWMNEESFVGMIFQLLTLQPIRCNYFYSLIKILTSHRIAALSSRDISHSSQRCYVRPCHLEQHTNVTYSIKSKTIFNFYVKVSRKFLILSHAHCFSEKIVLRGCPLICTRVSDLCTKCSLFRTAVVRFLS